VAALAARDKIAGKGIAALIRIEVGAEIDRPVADVFAYLSDPKNLPEWNALVEEAKGSESPLRVGSTITTRAHFLGRKIEAVARVTEHLSGEKFTQKATEPFPLTISNVFAVAGGGTRVTTIFEGEPGGFFKIGEPILARIVKKQMQAQLDTLKELLEARTPAGVW